MQVVWFRTETMFRLLCTRGRWKQTCINKICWGVLAEHSLLQSFPSRRQQGNAQDSEVCLASSHLLIDGALSSTLSALIFFFLILYLSVFAVWLYPTSEMAAGAPDTLWLFEVRQCLNRLYKDEGTSLTESSLFPLSSPQWGFPSGRRFRRVVLLWGTGDELSPMNVCKVASSGFFWGRPLMWQWCTMWDGRILEEAVSQSLFGLVVPVVIVYSHINLFWVKKDLTHVSATCANSRAEVCSVFVLCLHFNFLH